MSRGTVQAQVADAWDLTSEQGVERGSFEHLAGEIGECQTLNPVERFQVVKVRSQSWEGDPHVFALRQAKVSGESGGRICGEL